MLLLILLSAVLHLCARTMPTYHSANGEFVDYYSLLGVARNAGESAIISAYRKEARRSHPDKAGESSNSTQLMQALNAARETLTNASERRAHDAALAQHLGEPRKTSFSRAAAAASRRRRQEWRAQFTTPSYTEQPPPSPPRRRSPRPKPPPPPQSRHQFIPKLFEAFQYYAYSSTLSPFSGLPEGHPVAIQQSMLVHTMNQICAMAIQTSSSLHKLYEIVQKQSPDPPIETQRRSLAIIDVLTEMMFFTAAGYQAWLQRTERIVRTYEAHYKWSVSRQSHIESMDPRLTVDAEISLEKARACFEDLHNALRVTADRLQGSIRGESTEVVDLDAALGTVQKLITRWNEFCVLPPNIQVGLREALKYDNGKFWDAWRRLGMSGGSYEIAEFKQHVAGGTSDSG